MKFAACYIVLNEEDYIYYSLKSIYDFADQIIIIHGATQHASLVNSEGLSVDGTAKEIQRFIDECDSEGKVELVEHKNHVVKGKEDLRNAYIDRVRKDIDWVFVVDGDELYTPTMLQRIKNAIINNPECVHFFWRWYWFWGDMQHMCVYNEDYIKKSEKFNKYMKFWDRTGYMCRQGEFHERLFKNGLGFRHTHSHSVVTDSKNRDVYIDADYQDKRLVIQDVFMHHYGYIKKKELLFEKFNHYFKRDGGSNPFDTKPEYFAYLEGKDINSELKSIVEFKGEHPEVMLQHPYFGKKVNQL